eukprot:14708541-Ditylum_brightwellii.AAC.1
MLIVDKQNSGMEANGGEIGTNTTAEGTSTTAGGHTFTVNVHMHTSPTNLNVDSKSSANTSRQVNGKSSTPHINNLNKEGFSEDAGPFAYGKITSVPSKMKGIHFYTIKYDNTHEKLLIYSTQVPGIHKMKSFLKRAISCADQMG